MKKLALATAILATALVIPACTPAGTSNATREEYSKLYADISEEMLAAATPEVVPTALVPADNYGHVYSTGAFVYFVSELYKNEAFTITEAPVKFTCSYELTKDNYEVVFRSYVNKGENKVIGDFFVTDYTENRTWTSYIYIDVDYDFAKESIISFVLYVDEWESNDMNACSVYEEGILYELEFIQDETFAEHNAKMLEKKGNFKNALSNTLDLKHDFTDEYTRSMDFVKDEVLG